MARAAGLRAAAGRALPAQRWGEGGGGICTVVICSDRVEDNVLLGPLEDIRQVRLVESVDHLGDVVVADRGNAHIVVRHVISRDAFGVRQGHTSIRGYGVGEDRRGRGGGRTPIATGTGQQYVQQKGASPRGCKGQRGLGISARGRNRWNGPASRCNW